MVFLCGKVISPCSWLQSGDFALTQYNDSSQTERSDQSEDDQVILWTSLFDEAEPRDATDNDEEECHCIEHHSCHHSLHATFQTHLYRTTDEDCLYGGNLSTTERW